MICDYYADYPWPTRTANHWRFFKWTSSKLIDDGFAKHKHVEISRATTMARLSLMATYRMARLVALKAWKVEVEVRGMSMFVYDPDAGDFAERMKGDVVRLLGDLVTLVLLFSILKEHPLTSSRATQTGKAEPEFTTTRSISIDLTLNNITFDIHFSLKHVGATDLPQVLITLKRTLQVHIFSFVLVPASETNPVLYHRILDNLIFLFPAYIHPCKYLLYHIPFFRELHPTHPAYITYKARAKFQFYNKCRSSSLRDGTAIHTQVVSRADE